MGSVNYTPTGGKTEEEEEEEETRNAPPLTDGRLKFPCMTYSFPPPSDFNFHTKADFSGWYSTVPAGA